jgi:hypothetical protein
MGQARALLTEAQTEVCATQGEFVVAQISVCGF